VLYYFHVITVKLFDTICIQVGGRQRKRWEDNIRKWTGLELSEPELGRSWLPSLQWCPTIQKTMG